MPPQVLTILLARAASPIAVLLKAIHLSDGFGLRVLDLYMWSLNSFPRPKFEGCSTTYLYHRYGKRP